MAIKQEIVDRYKSQGFFKHVEWNRKIGILVKIFDQKPGETAQTISFEAGEFDVEYDQYISGYRQFFLSRKDTVMFMLNMGLGKHEIANSFHAIDRAEVVFKHV
jgi:hypothetical protein